MQGHDDPRTAILELLAEQERLYCRMIPVAEAKRAALLSGDTDALAPLVRELETLAARAEELERSRVAHVARLAGCADGETVSFDEVATRYDGAGRERLAGLRAALHATLVTVKCLNDANAALARQALGITRQWAKLIGGGLPATYGASGVVAEPASMQSRQAWRA